MSLLLSHPHHESEIALNYQIGAALILVGLCLVFVFYSARAVRRNDEDIATSNILRGLIAVSNTHYDTRMAGWNIIRQSLSKSSTRRVVAADREISTTLRNAIRTASPDNDEERLAIDAVESLLGAVHATAK